MITLISGSPGSGKTAYVIDLLSKETSRPIFICGIKTSLPVSPVPPISEWTRTVPLPEDPSIQADAFDFPDGSIIVLDEAQNIYRPRPVSSKLPAIVSAFETHRHFGLDFYLITQRPAQIDSHVRRLVSTHIHLVNSWSGRKLFEWTEYADVENKSSFSCAVHRPYKLNSSVFHLYESASIHTKVVKRRPLSFYFLIAFLIIFFLLAFYIFRSISSRVSPNKSSSISPSSSHSISSVSSSVAPSLSASIPSSSVSTPPPLSPASFTPRLSIMPETAPVYDEIRQVKSLPSVVGCIQSASDCRCYTSQGTDVLFTRELCLSWIKQRPFNPFRSSPDSSFQSDSSVSSSAVTISSLSK